MIKLENQTLYKCSYCSKRLLTKRGCKVHETIWCNNPLSPAQMVVAEKQAACQHSNVDEIWSYIPGEAVKQPDHDQCLDCGKRL